ncbi:carboxypeptidase regulatory-like domain-containing protein [Candidatus Saccharibacteria bacterium]|nr:carboxypeptidase regulatory-like domain-containing protein [Candidatus Saccharibacteria bacterium]
MTRRGEAGFTLIETIVGLVVMTIMVTAISQLFIDNLHVVTVGKARAIGLALAQEQIENLRDLPYQSLATQFGEIYPPGILPDNQILVRGGYTFTVNTSIKYVDDPYDGNAAGTIPGKPVDKNPGDYKRAEISVYLKTSGQLVAQLTTDLAAKASETSSNTGVLSIKVIDSNGNPVPQANVTIFNPNPNPDVNIATTTDNLGFVTVPDLPLDSSNRYVVTASLPGYSTSGSTADPAGPQTATIVNPNVLVQQVTAITLSIDHTSNLSLHVEDTNGNPVSALKVTTSGAKTIYQNPSVSKYSIANTTDGTGNINLTGLEWDSYSFAVASGYYLVSAQPYAPLILAPGTTSAVNLVVTTNSNYPTITNVSPNASSTGNNAMVMTITGTHLSSSSTITLKSAGQPDINATGITSGGGDTSLSGTFNFTGAPTGSWDVVVTSNGNTVTQTGGFSVTP